MTREVNVFNLGKQPRDIEDQTFEVNLIENITNEHKEELKLETESKFELESIDFDQIIESTVNWASSSVSPSLESTNLTPPSIELSFFLELKTLPKHLKYIFLGEQETLSVIIRSHLTDREEENLMSILTKNREFIG